MSKIKLRTSLANVEQRVNTTGEFSPIFIANVESQQVYELFDRAGRRTPLIAKLKDSSGDELPADTEIVLGIQTPSKHTPDEIAFTNYDIYRELSLAKQSNEENQDLLHISLDEQGYRIFPDYKLIIQINSSAQVDWSNSEIIIPVEEKRAKNFQ